MRLFYFTCSAVFYPQSDVRWGNIMCYHGGDQQTQRGCKKNTMAAWGWGLPAQLLGEGQKITPSGYQLPKRGSASTVTIRSKKWGHKSSRPEKMSHLLLLVSEPSSWGPQSGRVSCPPRTHLYLSSFICTYYKWVYLPKNSRTLDNMYMYKLFVQYNLLSQKIIFAIFKYTDPIKSPCYTTSVFAWQKWAELWQQTSTLI